METTALGDSTHHLLRLRGLLAEAEELVDRIDEGTPAPDDERKVLGITAQTLSKHQPRTRADVLRFAEAVQGGDEAWLVVHSIPGQHRTEAVYLATLPPSVRKTLDI